MRHAAHIVAVSLSLAIARSAAGATPAFFDQPEAVELTLTAPFEDLFARASHDAEASVAAMLTLGRPDGPGSMTLSGLRLSERGHTSRQPSECAFPKLRLDLTGADRVNTPLAGIDVLKIGTHCGDAPDGTLTPKYGRLANDRAPRREAMVYRMLAAAGIPTLRARTARITYVFEGSTTRAPLTRYALLLEDDDAAMTRVGGSGSFDEDTFDAASRQFAPSDTARLAFAEAMIGNFDWCVRMFPGDIYRCDDRHPLWNVLAFTRPGGRTVPMPYDFDLSGPVVGRHVWYPQVFDDAFTVPPSAVMVEVLAQVQRTRSLFERTLLDDTRRYFLGVRDSLIAAIDNADADDSGKRFAHAYLTAFYAAIERDEDFYRPVVVEGGHRASLDAEGTQPACGTESVVPGGTPVSPPLEVRAGRMRVRVLDALWAWTGDNRCDAIHRQPVWLDASAIGTEYPR